MAIYAIAKWPKCFQLPMFRFSHKCGCSFNANLSMFGKFEVSVCSLLNVNTIHCAPIIRLSMQVDYCFGRLNGVVLGRHRRKRRVWSQHSRR